MVNSKQKGSSFEREVCKKLALWVSGGTKDDLFWRAAMSGGRATVAMKKGGAAHRVSGDVASVAPEGHALTDHFSIECKHLADLGLGQFFIKGTGEMAKIWKACIKHAAHHNKRPMLIARQNLFPTIVVTVRDTFGEAQISTLVWDVTTLEALTAMPYHEPRLRMKL